MAFNFLGTLTLEDLSALRNFLQGEIDYIDQEINSLRIQQSNLQKARIQLLKADEFFGGSAMQSIHDQDFVKLRTIPIQDDSNIARLVNEAKKPFFANIKYKRERIEHKVLKLTDAIEQIGETMDRKAIAKTDTLGLLNQVQTLFDESTAAYAFRSEIDKENIESGATN